jgi:hypothetical protein
MNVPGFNAEACLYKTTERYRGAGRFHQFLLGIQPAYNCYFLCYIEYRSCLAEGLSHSFCAEQHWLCVDNCP